MLNPIDSSQSTLRVAEAWSEKFSHLQTVVYCVNVYHSADAMHIFAHTKSNPSCGRIAGVTLSTRKWNIDNFNKRILRVLTMTKPQPSTSLPNVECIVDLRPNSPCFGMIRIIKADGDYELWDVLEAHKNVHNGKESTIP